MNIATHTYDQWIIESFWVLDIVLVALYSLSLDHCSNLSTNIILIYISEMSKLGSEKAVSFPKADKW